MSEGGGDEMFLKLTACGIAIILAVAGCASVEESAVYSPEEMTPVSARRIPAKNGSRFPKPLEENSVK